MKVRAKIQLSGPLRDNKREAELWCDREFRGEGHQASRAQGCHQGVRMMYEMMHQDIRTPAGLDGKKGKKKRKRR